jgi:hypothetical protein
MYKEITPEEADVLVTLGVEVLARRWDTSHWDHWDSEGFDSASPSDWYNKKPVGGHFSTLTE